MLNGLVLDLLCVSSPLLFFLFFFFFQLSSYSLIRSLPLQYSLYITNLHIWPFGFGNNDVSVWRIEICIATCFRFFFFRMQLRWWMWWYFSWKADFYLIWLTKHRFPLPFGSVLYGGNPMGLLSLGPAFWNAYLYLLCKTNRFKIHIVFKTILNCVCF